MLQGKKLRSNEEVITETEAYFEIVFHKGHRKVTGTFLFSLVQKVLDLYEFLKMGSSNRITLYII